MMARPPGRAVKLSLRCYPERWRARHGAEAADLAASLVEDGMAPGSVAWSYFKGAARERLAPTSSGRPPVTATALLAVISLAGVSMALSFAPPTAGATSVARAEAAAGYGSSAAIFRPGEALECSSVVGQSVKAALGAVDHLGVKVVWDVDGAKARPGTVPPGSYRVTGGRALSATVLSIDVAPPGRSAARLEGPRGRHC